MKKICVSFVVFLCVILFLLIPSGMTQAEEVKKSETEIGIELEIFTPKEDKVKPPLINGGDNMSDHRLLPQTGELLTSLIIVLIGISLLIFVLGVLSIKQIYQTTYWEV